MSNLLEKRLGVKNSQDSPRVTNEIPTAPQVINVPTFDSEAFELEEEIKEANKIKELEKFKKRNAIADMFSKVFLIAGIFYVIFLIYGVIITEYEYDETGETAPVVYSIDEIKEKTNYELFKVYYLNIRNLYEEIIVLDYRLGLGNEEYVTLSSEYEELLDTVNNLVVQLEAYEPPADYRQTYNLMLQLTKTDIAIYLQNISAALAHNNEDKANKAIINKETVYNEFLQLTNNVITLGDSVKGIDTSDLKEWSIDAVREREVGL